MKTRPLVAALLTLSLSLGASAAFAQHDHDRDHAIPGRMVFDTRYHHDHYYPAVGFVAPGLPRGAMSVGWHGGNYWFSGGVWYSPWHGHFRVVLPPFGIVVPLLPDAYVTVQLGGVPYYYANGAYYQAAPGGYVVVQPPPDADQAVGQPSPPPTAPQSRPDPVIYPRNGQTPQQQEADMQACNRWATSQPAATSDASVFSRAVDACMDGRGYTVR